MNKTVVTYNENTRVYEVWFENGTLIGTLQTYSEAKRVADHFYNASDIFARA